MSTTPMTAPEKPLLTMQDALNQYCSDFEGFMQKYIRSKHPPFFYFMAWLLGVERSVEKMESSFFDNVPLSDSWGNAWFLIAVQAILFGFLAYWINGIWYHLRVLFCGGVKVFRTSLNINLYTGLPLYLSLLLVYILNMTLYGNSYFSKAFIPGVEALPLMLVVLGAAMYSIWLSYRAVRFIQGTKKISSIFWFVVLPVPFYLLLSFAFIPG